MPRLARPKKRAEALHGDDFPPSIDDRREGIRFDVAIVARVVFAPSRRRRRGSAISSHIQDDHGWTANVHLRASRGPLGEGKGRKWKERNRRRGSGGALPTLSSSSPSTSNSPALLPPVPDDLLKKASALEKTVRSSPPPPLPPPVTTLREERRKSTKKQKRKKSQRNQSSSSFSLWPPRFPSSLPSLPSLPSARLPLHPRRRPG